MTSKLLRDNVTNSICNQDLHFGFKVSLKPIAVPLISCTTLYWIQCKLRSQPTSMIKYMIDDFGLCN